MQGFYRYNIFITHYWEYDDYYNNLVKLINNASYFPSLIFSIPESKYIDNEKSINKELIEELCTQILPVDIVLASTDMFNKHREWINFEIEIALFFDKPIIGIRSSSSEQIPEIITSNACDIVDLDIFSITYAITKYASF